MPGNTGEALLDRPQTDLITHQRQAMLGSLSGIIVHEYNNLMTPVMVRAQDALSRDDVAAMRKALTITLAQTQQALDFTRQVLEVARGQELPVRACKVAELVDAAIAAAVRPFSKDGVEVVLHVPAELEVRAQPLLFVQVLLNLLLNARTAMKDRRGRLSISAGREADSIVIDVSDSGVGMSPSMLNDVVNPFLEVRDEGRFGDQNGVGLGLLTCRTIAHQHGATLQARDNEGPGCTFCLKWPAA